MAGMCTFVCPHPYMPETMESLFIVVHPVFPGGEALGKLHVGKQHLHQSKHCRVRHEQGEAHAEAKLRMSQCNYREGVGGRGRWITEG